jgi:hypothetical protein
MPSEPVREVTLQECFTGILTAGQRLRSALDLEHSLSDQLDLEPGDPHLTFQLHIARHQTELAFEQYNQSVRYCAKAAAENNWTMAKQPRFWSRVATAVAHPFRGRKQRYHPA